jgi:glycerol-3-phosphate cytidylyltransferase
MSKGKIGFTCSAFDLLHAGHILMLEEAKHHCDWLIVGLQNDPSNDRLDKNKPVQSIIERYIQLTAVKYVDDVIVYNNEKDLEDLLRVLPIDVRILGDEYKDKPFTGRDICARRGVELIFNKREHSFSTTELRDRVYHTENMKDRKKITITKVASVGEQIRQKLDAEPGMEFV